MARKYQVNYFTTAANANQQLFTYQTNDDSLQRKVVELYVGLATSGVNVQLNKSGSDQVQVDCTRFANGNYPLAVDIDFPPSLQIQVLIQNLAGAALTNVPVVIGYEVNS